MPGIDYYNQISVNSMKSLAFSQLSDDEFRNYIIQQTNLNLKRNEIAKLRILSSILFSVNKEEGLT